MEINFLYIFLIISLLVGTFLLYKVEGKIQLNQINIFNWTFFVEFMAMGAVSPFFILNIKPNNWAIQKIPDSEFPLKEVVLTLCWCAIAIPLGIYLMKLTLKHFRLNRDFFEFQNIKDIASCSNLFYFLWIFIFLCYSAYLVNQIGFIPQIKVFSLSSIQDIAKLRGDITHNLPANIIIFRLIGLALSPILCYSAFAKFLKNKNLSSFTLFAVFLIFSIFFNTLNLNKSAIAFILVGLAATFPLVGINFSIKKMFIFGTAMTLLLVAMFKITIPGRSIETSLVNVAGRIFISQTYGNYASFYVFPKHEEHIGFRSLTKQIKKLGFEPKERASRTLMKHMAPENVKAGTAGHMVSTFFAEAWANWGLVGIILSPIFVGLSLKFLVNLFIWFPKSELSIGFISFLTYTFGINKSFSKILFPRYLIASIIILFTFYFIEQKLLKRSKSTK